MRLKLKRNCILFIVICWCGISPVRSNSDLPSGWRSLIANDTFSYSVQHFRRPSPTGGARDASIIEGDIRSTMPVYDHRHGQRFFNAVVQEMQIWSGGIIPYILDSSFSWPEREMIREAMNDIERNTCVRFIESNGPSHYVDHTDYIRIEKTPATCSSYVGRIGVGEQEITLAPGCMKKLGEIQHELLHALGLYHEQSRMDRDEYVYIAFENIFTSGGSDLTSQFDKYESNTFGLPYDYESIMHYGHNYFSRSAHLPTIVPRRRNSRQQPVRLGNREKMTDIDTQKIAYLYKCLFISYENSPTTTRGHVRHVTRRRHLVTTSTTTRRSRALTTTLAPSVRLSDDDLYQLRKNKYNNSKNAWRIFKNAVKQQGSKGGGLYRFRQDENPSRHNRDIDTSKPFIFRTENILNEKNSAGSYLHINLVIYLFILMISLYYY